MNKLKKKNKKKKNVILIRNYKKLWSMIKKQIDDPIAWLKCEQDINQDKKQTTNISQRWMQWFISHNACWQETPGQHVF